MSNQQHIGLTHLIKGLQKFAQAQYNGKVKINSKTGQVWILYFRLGRIVWAGGGEHPFRRFRRQVTYYCPHLTIEQIPFYDEDTKTDCWDYIIFKRLNDKQIIGRKQVNNLIETTILEVLFDIAQQTSFLSFVVEHFHNSIFDQPIHFANIDVCLKIIMQSQKDWEEAGLGSFSPNSAPLISRKEQLEKIVNPNVYKSLVELIDGKNTLRDLAVKMNKDQVSVSRSLLPYIFKGIIKLVEVSDFPLKGNQSNKHSGTIKAKSKKLPLVVCVDDSPQVCEMMEKILLPYDLRFISITDSTKALPVLIQQKPDIIFLDLVMPIVNGHEICSQLRRTSIFKDVPVILISASDGLLDRVRAETGKVMGATDFINKPISSHKVLHMINKYLHSQELVAKKVNPDTAKIDFAAAKTA